MDAHDRLPAEAPADWRFALVRSVLEEDPRDARAVAVVRAAIPESIRPAADADFDALDWLAFVEAESQTPLKVLFPPARETPELSTSQRLVGRYANVWRKDIIGLESDNLLILSPVARPGAVARCLAYGEALCAVLEEMFALAVPESGEDLRGGLDQPLVLQLFASRDEYLSGAGDPSRGPEAASGLAWTAGHYDAKANVSRIFVPDDDRELDSVLQTYLHELAHHWLQMKCPLYSLDQTFARTGVEPGFWVAEGFASMVEEFRIEPRTRRWIAENTVSRNLDLVANAGEKAYVPWKLLFELSQARFWRLESTGEATIPSTTRLGAAYPWTAKAMFYAQSAATARWLWLGEEGRNRLVLLEFVRDFYTGKKESLDLAKRLGRTPEEIGRAIAEYARAELTY